MYRTGRAGIPFWLVSLEARRTGGPQGCAALGDTFYLSSQTQAGILLNGISMLSQERHETGNPVCGRGRRRRGGRGGAPVITVVYEAQRVTLAFVMRNA